MIRNPDLMLCGNQLHKKKTQENPNWQRHGNQETVNVFTCPGPDRIINVKHLLARSNSSLVTDQDMQWKISQVTKCAHISQDKRTGFKC